MLGVDQATVRRWVTAGKIAAIRLPSGQARIKQETVDAILGTDAQPQAVGA